MRSESDSSSLAERLTLGLAASIGVILILVSGRWQGYMSGVISDLGDALVIAALVGVFVELRLVKASMERMEAIGMRTVSEIKAVVVPRLRKHLPPQKVDALESQVLDPTFLREGIQIFITLARDLNKERVKGTVSIKYNVRNLSAKPQTYPVRLNLDEVFGERSAMLQDAKINGQPVNLSSLPQGARLFREANVLQFEHPVAIPAEGSAYVELKGYQIMADADVWPWHLMGISDSFQITVNYPPETLSVWLLAKHPSAASASDFGVVNLGTIQTAIEDIILPYQGFEVRWRPSPQLLPEPDAVAAPANTKP